MDLAAALAVRDRLKADATLAQFWQTHYGKAAEHLIGYRRPMSAQQTPSVCYAGFGRIDQSAAEVAVSVVIGVHDQGVTDGLMDGEARVHEAARLMLAALATQPLTGGWLWLARRYQTVPDLCERHPFHELEIQLHLKLVGGD